MEDGSAIQDELISRNRSYWDFSVYSSKNKTNTASVVYLGNRFDNVQSQNEVIWERGLVPGCYQEKITCTFRHRGSRGEGPVYDAWHWMQDLTTSSTCSSIPGNQAFSLIICLVFTMPWCDWCAISMTFLWSTLGITRRWWRSSSHPGLFWRSHS